jgi:hypothetical protein
MPAGPYQALRFAIAVGGEPSRAKMPATTHSRGRQRASQRGSGEAPRPRRQHKTGNAERARLLSCQSIAELIEVRWPPPSVAGHQARRFRVIDGGDRAASKNARNLYASVADVARPSGLPSRRSQERDPSTIHWAGNLVFCSARPSCVAQPSSASTRSPLSRGNRQMVYLQSTAIRAVAWNSMTSTLDITFTSGATHSYYDVPQSKYLGLITALSPGQYFNINIREQHTRLIGVFRRRNVDSEG